MRYVCKYCNKIFYAKPAEKRKYCSRDCFHKAEKEGMVKRGPPPKPKYGKDNHLWKGGKITVTCAECGKTFKIFPCRKDKIIYCSLACRKLGKSKKMKHRIGILNPRFKGGRYKNAHGYWIRTLSSLSDEERQLAKKMVTRTTILEHRVIIAKEIGRPLTKKDIVHHKNEIKGDNRIENLELLSISAHCKGNLLSHGTCPRCGYIW